jgi:hypothetical protein
MSHFKTAGSYAFFKAILSDILMRQNRDQIEKMIVEGMINNVLIKGRPRNEEDGAEAIEFYYDGVPYVVFHNASVIFDYFANQASNPPFSFPNRYIFVVGSKTWWLDFIVDYSAKNQLSNDQAEHAIRQSRYGTFHGYPAQHTVWVKQPRQSFLMHSLHRESEIFHRLQSPVEPCAAIDFVLGRGQYAN